MTTTVIGRPGGKTRLKKTILEHIIPHERYVEPFFGGGAVFFAKDPSKEEIINDLDPNVFQIHKDVQETPNLCCNMEGVKEKWEDIKHKLEAGKQLTPCERIYLTAESFGSVGRGFGQRGKKRGTVCFNKQQQRLQNVKIENKNALHLIKEQDSPQTFFYLDPPYYQTACAYGLNKDVQKDLCKIQPTEIADLVRDIQGKFLLSYNDHPDVRKAFDGFKIQKVETKYSFAAAGDDKNAHHAKELLISNY